MYLINERARIELKRLNINIIICIKLLIILIVAVAKWHEILMQPITSTIYTLPIVTIYTSNTFLLLGVISHHYP